VDIKTASIFTDHYYRRIVCLHFGLGCGRGAAFYYKFGPPYRLLVKLKLLGASQLIKGKRSSGLQGVLFCLAKLPDIFVG
jgi:hypothetical protein